MDATGFAPALVPSIRVSDAERERVATFLRERCGEGRLDLDELGERLERVYGARTAPELVPLVADLPGAAGVVPGAPTPHPRRLWRRLAVRLTLLAGIVLVGAALLEAVLVAPLELGILMALLAVLAVLVLEVVLAALPAVVLLGLACLVVRTVRRRPAARFAPPR